MRVHKTKYAALSNEDLIKLADQQGFNLSDIGLELMQRLTEAIENHQDEITKLDSEVRSLKNDIKTLQDELDELS